MKGSIFLKISEQYYKKRVSSVIYNLEEEIFVRWELSVIGRSPTRSRNARCPVLG